MKLVQKIRGIIRVLFISILNSFYNVRKLREVLNEVLVFFVYMIRTMNGEAT